MPYKRKRKGSTSKFWWVSFTDANGKRVRCSTGTTERKEAQALEAKWKAEAFNCQAWGNEPGHTFEELMVGYLKETGLEKRSAKADRSRTKNLRAYLGGMLVNDLRPLHIRGYIQHRRKEEISDSTINRELSLLSTAITYATGNGSGISRILFAVENCEKPRAVFAGSKGPKQMRW